MITILFSALCFANPEMEQQEQPLSSIELIEYNQFSIAPKYMTQLSNPIKSENTLRNTFLALGTVSFVVSRYFYREAENRSTENSINEIVTYEEYEKEEIKYAQIRKRYWFTSILSLGFYSGGLTIHLLERAEEKKSEKSTSTESQK